MVRVHTTRVMRSGEMVLWRAGTMVWRVAGGTDIEAIIFDTISLHVDDGKQLTARLPCPPTDRQVLEAVARWWD